jgi:hypothetical protein
MPAHRDHLRIELARQRSDNSIAEAGLRLGKGAVWFANSVVGDHKFPVLAENVISDGDPRIFGAFVESVLEAAWSAYRPLDLRRRSAGNPQGSGPLASTTGLDPENTRLEDL